MFSSGDDRSRQAGLVHFVGADQVDDRVDERQVGEGLREVPEVTPGMRVDLHVAARRDPATRSVIASTPYGTA
jgi:hypothetical protein